MPTAKQTIDWYDQNAERYASEGAKNSPYHQYYEKPAIYSLLPSLHGKNVLSLGCGSGEDSAHLKELGASRSVGIDISKGLIKIAKRDHPECEFVVGSMEDLPYGDQEFDLVYSSFALHYLPTYENAFSEAFRVLKFGGYIVFSAGHPLGLSMEEVANNEEIKDKRIGVVKNKKTGKRHVYGDYLSTNSFRTNLPDFDVTSWKQPISATVSQLANAGFVIEQMLEPKPTPEFAKIDPEGYKRLLRIPDILILKARKPSKNT